MKHTAVLSHNGNQKGHLKVAIVATCKCYKAIYKHFVNINITIFGLIGSLGLNSRVVKQFFLVYR